jgi:hypothetical protein
METVMSNEAVAVLSPGSVYCSLGLVAQSHGRRGWQGRGGCRAGTIGTVGAV